MKFGFFSSIIIHQNLVKLFQIKNCKKFKMSKNNYNNDNNYVRKVVREEEKARHGSRSDSRNSPRRDGKSSNRFQNCHLSMRYEQYNSRSTRTRSRSPRRNGGLTSRNFTPAVSGDSSDRSRYNREDVRPVTGRNGSPISTRRRDDGPSISKHAQQQSIPRRRDNGPSTSNHSQQQSIPETALERGTRLGLSRLEKDRMKAARHNMEKFVDQEEYAKKLKADKISAEAEARKRIAENNRLKMENRLLKRGSLADKKSIRKGVVVKHKLLALQALVHRKTLNFDAYIQRSKEDLEFLRLKYKLDYSRIHDKCGEILFEVTDEVVERMTIDEFNEYASQVDSWTAHVVEDTPVKTREVWKRRSTRNQNRDNNKIRIQIDNPVVTTDVIEESVGDVITVGRVSSDEEVPDNKSPIAEEKELEGSDDEKLLDSDDAEMETDKNKK